MISNPFTEDVPSANETPLPEAPDNWVPSNSFGKGSALQQDSIVPKGWKATMEQPLPVIRCTGTVRSGEREGQRCGRWSLAGASVCLVHGGHLPSVKKAAQERVETAKLRLIEDADLAIDTLFALLQPGTAAQVQLGAANSILDRAGVKGGTELSVEITAAVSAADSIAERLKSIAGRAEPEEIVDAEVVDNEQPTE